MKIERRTLEKNLPRKGFVRKPDGDHIYFYHRFAGRYTGAHTYVSHSPKFRDISNDILTSMRRQLHLDKNSEVVALVNCPMSEDQYNAILRGKGKLPNP